MKGTPFAVAMLMLAACGGSGTATCGEAECASVCAAKPDAPAPATAGPTLSTFESNLLGPLVEDVRQGVRPWNEEGIGICEGTRNCDKFLGLTAMDLPEGKYMVRADLAVPNVGDKGTWTIRFDTECTTTRTTENGETSSTSNYSRDYEVRYAGKDRGYRLQPLRTIESPSRGGARKCTYKIVAPHPDGDKVYEGTWSTPDADLPGAPAGEEEQPPAVGDGGEGQP